MAAIKAERATVEFFDGLSVDGYRMPNGEFRLSLGGASKVLGFGRNWLAQVISRGEGTKKALQEWGFSGNIAVMSASRVGGKEIKTIGLKDFTLLIAYAVQQGKRPAFALQLALVELSLTDYFREAFGEQPLSFEEKRELFYSTYASTISPEHWRAMDKADIIALALPGDEDHLKGGTWNQ